MTTLICVVGKSGSGKSTFSKLLAENLKGKAINIDEIGHSIYDNPNFVDFIIKTFGQDFVNREGKIIDRKMIGDYIFSNKNSEKVQAFNKVSWNLMQEKIDEKLQNIEENYVILDWYNLQNTKYFEDADYKILVKPQDEEQRMMIVRLRDNISSEYLEKRENNGILYNDKDYNHIFINTYEDQKTIEYAKQLAEAIKVYTKSYIIEDNIKD